MAMKKVIDVKVFVLFIMIWLGVHLYLYTKVTKRNVKSLTLIQDTIDGIQNWSTSLEKHLIIQQNITSHKITESIYNFTHQSDNSTTLLVLFTTFADKKDKHVSINNTVSNWMSFGSSVIPVLFTSEKRLAERVRKKGWDVLVPSKAAIGIPVLKYMYMDVMQKYHAYFYAYANGDIMFTENLIDTLQFILASEIDINHPMLIVGQQTNVNNVTEQQASTLRSIVSISKTGQLFIVSGEDYFITNANYPWGDIPEVVVGRIAYDNWLVLNARQKNHTTIDATQTLLAVHQTTKAGNKEGHRHFNRNYNRILLAKIFKKINYSKGFTNCTALLTVYNKTSHKIQLQRRSKKVCP